MSKVIATPDQLKAAGKLFADMKAAGTLFVKEAPVWVSKVPLLEVLRKDCVEYPNTNSISIKTEAIPKEFKNDMTDVIFKCKGNGPVITISIAEAMRPYPWSFTNDKGVLVSGEIKKGTRMPRAFAI